MEPLDFEVRTRPQSRAPARQGYSPRHEAMEPRNGNSISVAARILSVADYEAATITQQASYQAAMITRQVAYEATEIREAARREADQIMQQAAQQAAAVRKAAEREAAEVRQTVMSMQAELGEFAARITDTFPNLPRIVPGQPPPELMAMASASAPPQAAPPALPAAPADQPAARPAGKPAAKPARKPAARPAGEPAAPPAKKAGSGKGRQAGAFRFAMIATSALLLIAVVAAAVEVRLHGFDFFIFRAAGTGETLHTGLQEDQGPGQPDAPKPAHSQIKAKPSPHGPATTHGSHN